MSVLIDRSTRVIVQGITGNHGRFHAGQMIEYGTDVAGGTRPGKGGESILERPIFDTVAEARERTGADCSVIFVPPPLAADAILEAVDAGIRLVVCITEGIPIRDMQLVRARVDRGGSRLLGPNCPGLLTPAASKVGIMPGTIASPGSVGVVSRSGTLTYEAVYALTERGIGQSTCIGIGGDPVNGTDFIDVLELFERDAGTDRVVLIGEIGGTDEQRAADYIRRRDVQAGGGLHRRTDGPGRQDHGPRRRAGGGRRGVGRRQDRRPPFRGRAHRHPPGRDPGPGQRLSRRTRRAQKKAPG